MVDGRWRKSEEAFLFEDLVSRVRLRGDEAGAGTAVEVVTPGI